VKFLQRNSRAKLGYLKKVTGQSKDTQILIARTGQADGTSITEQAEQGRQNRTARTRQAEEGRKDRTARTGMPKEDSQTVYVIIYAILVVPLNFSNGRLLLNIQLPKFSRESAKFSKV
jgi:hypothetical protein